MAVVEYRYDSRFRPPAPVVQIGLAAPGARLRVDLTALLDSGAAISVVPVVLVRQLHLPRVGVTEVRGFGGDTREAPVFAAELALRGSRRWISRVVTWGEAYAVLGMDAMNYWRIVLDGPTQTTSVG